MVPQKPQLTLDLPTAGFERTSILAARAMAARQTIGSDAARSSDAAMIGHANTIHARGADAGASAAERHASQALLAREAAIWARAMSAETLTPEDQVEGYLSLWSMALTPMTSPQFETREAIAERWSQAHIRTVPRSEPVSGSGGELGLYSGFGYRPARTDAEMETLRLAHKSMLLAFGTFNGLDRAYYKQFADYIEDQGPQFSKVFAWQEAQRAGLSWADYARPVEAAWTIHRLTGRWPEADDTAADARQANILSVLASSGGGGSMGAWHSDAFESVFKRPPLRAPIEEDETGTAYLYKDSTGKFGLVRPDGSLHRYETSPIRADGSIDPAAIGRAMGSFDRVVWQDLETSRRTGAEERVSTLLADGAANHLRLKLLAWKESGYDRHGLETVLRAVVPFYGNIVDAVNDPLSKVDVQSLVIDGIDLAVTLGTAGAGILSKPGFVAAKLGIKGLTGAAKASAILKIAVEHLATRDSAVLLGKGLADFVVPVSSVKDIVKSASSEFFHHGDAVLKPLGAGATGGSGLAASEVRAYTPKDIDDIAFIDESVSDLVPARAPEEIIAEGAVHPVEAPAAAGRTLTKHGYIGPEPYTREVFNHNGLKTYVDRHEEFMKPAEELPKNANGLLVRDDYELLFRADTRSPEDIVMAGGFEGSYHFYYDRMTDEMALITSASVDGAMTHGRAGEAFTGNRYFYYAIEAKGRPAVSLNENALKNAEGLANFREVDPVYFRAEPRQGVDTYFGETWKVDEVHVEGAIPFDKIYVFDASHPGWNKKLSDLNKQGELGAFGYPLADLPEAKLAPSPEEFLWFAA
ncbi:hypothetical protein FHS85_001209 [Rhodoligotrophos appendicifer]|uniref:hypothetical protein n=1 Tax=Rhodoligotrophos appendicifer TaxID=987056 RepID=UPI00118470B1|nr:hypothetical protein [Rhodoligotrophos appendicifer]